MSRTFSRKTVFALIVALAAIPALSFAEVYPCDLSFVNSCVPGIVRVYVQVPQNDFFAPILAPANVTVSVHTQSPTARTFPGSRSGTLVSVAGSYSVTVAQQQNYIADYSSGCSGTVLNREEAMCYVTMKPVSEYYSAQPYLYTYTNQTLRCAPAYQTIPMGQAVSFEATGGTGVYNWSTSDNSQQATGPRFNTQPRVYGAQTVQVMDGKNVAVCTVTVVGATSPLPYYTPNTGYMPTYTAAAPVVTTNYIAALPNTGFEPVSATQLALALVLLLGVGIFVAPYVRHTFSTITSR